MISTIKLWLLRPKLRNSDVQVRQQAVQAIGELGTRGAVKLLLRCLEGEDDAPVIAHAATALAQIGTAPAIDGLVAAVRGPNRVGFAHIIHALSGVNDPRAIPGILDALTHDAAWDSVSMSRAMTLLKKHADERVRAGLREALRHNGSQVRWHVVQALGALHDEAAVEAIVATLDDDTLCTAAAEALQSIGSPRAVPGLVRVLTSRPQIQRGAALEALRSLGWHPTGEKEEILQELAEGNYAGAALRGASAVEPLMRELQIGSTAEAIAALGQIGDPRAVPALVASGLANREHAAAACRALGTFRDPRAIPLVLEVLAEKDQDPDGQRRAAAAWAAGQIGDVRAAPALRAALQCSQDNVVAAAAEALGNLHDKPSLPQLVAALQHKPCADHRLCWQVRRAAAEALGKIGDLHAVKPLLLALKHEGWHDYSPRAARARGTPNATTSRPASQHDDDHAPQVDQAIATALAHLNHPQTIDAIGQLLDSEDAPIPGVVDVLERLPDPRSTELLRRILHGAEGERRCHAAQALARRHDPAGIEFLIKTLAPVADEWSEGRTLASPELEFAARYLGELNEPAAVAPLLQALKGLRGPVRGTLRLALRRILEHAASRVDQEALLAIEHELRGEDGEVVALAQGELHRRVSGTPAEGGVDVTCTCGRHYHVQPEFHGKRLKCRHCGHAFVA